MLRSVRKDKRIDLVQSFRDLAPPRERISIQRWSHRRIAMAVVTVLAILILISVIIDNIRGQGFI
jgi:hypothetical protein